MNRVEICCNMCGRKIREEAGILREDCVTIKKQWGFFSSKDGEIHTIHLCEECYDRWVKTLQVPPKIEEAVELLS
ncbi:MAG: hypothetical protein Q4B70_06365 [Lachnospiraceae bacterium]|nr:hypothetical protein [Lachnospiraceae bacterium]